MKKTAGLIIIFSVISMYIILIVQGNNSIKTDVFQVDHGYGYLIIRHQKVLIKQDFIPAIQDQVPFCSENDALVIAKLVKNKIENKLPPTISLQDLNKYNIQTSCSK